MFSSRIIATALVVVAASFATMPASAASDVDSEQRAQQIRINEGLRSGRLTRPEAARLQAEHDRIAALVRRARVDGRVDPYERGEIVKAQSEASRHIYAEKHDGEVQGRPVQRGGWWYRGYGEHRRWW